MRLSKRLKLIADKVPSCDTLADIGSDHAYVPIYLIENNICKKALATDIKDGPNLVAQKNIKKFDMEKRIEILKGSGLKPIKEKEVEIIIIAGLGGVQITEILENDFEKAKKSRLIILQPMNYTELVRKWLNSNGFKICDEELIKEDNKLYVVISVVYTGKNRTFDEFDFYIGRSLIEKNDPLLLEYIKRNIKKVEKILTGMQKKRMPDIFIEKRYENLLSFLKNLKEKFS